MLNGELIEGKHPPLIDEAIWEACQEVRARNLRRTSKNWTRHSYPLTPLLRCGVCGDAMFGKTATNPGRTYLYYACRNAQHSRSAVAPRLPTCPAKLIKAHIFEEGIREELGRCLPTDDLHQQYRDELWEAVSRARRPETLKETAIRRLDSQLDRARRLFELGEYDKETFMLKRSAIRQEQERLKAENGHLRRSA
jgi:site-specific DNA recombinase